MKALPAIVIIISLFSACTTGKPPYIENSYYKNPSFEYSFKLPFGWVQTDKLPEFLNSAIPNRSKRNVNFSLFNNDANGIMHFSSAGIVSDTTAMSNEQLQKALISLIEEKVESFNNQLSIANVNMNKSYNSMFKFLSHGGNEMNVVAESGNTLRFQLSQNRHRNIVRPATTLLF